MPNVLLVNGNPSQGGTDGTLVTSGNPVTPDLLTTGNDAETAPLKLAVRTNPGYERTGPSAISLQGANASKWALAADSNGVPGAWNAWGAPLLLSPTLRATNQIFWIKARVTSDESYPTLFNDGSVTLSLPDDAYLLVAVGRSLAEPYGVINAASRALGIAYTVRNIVGRSLDQSYSMVGQAGRSLVAPYTILQFPALSLGMPYAIKVAVGRSLAQPSAVNVAVGRSNAMPYYCGNNYPTTILGTTGLGSYWQLQEASGNVVDSKAGFTGTPIASSVLSYQQSTARGALGYAIKSNGATPTGIDCGDHYNGGGTADYSIEFWAKRGSSGSGRIISHYDENLGKGWHVGFDGAGKIYSQRHTGSTNLEVTSTVQLSNSQFDHVVVTYTNSDGKLRIYINGALNATSSGSDTGSVTANTLPLTFFRTPVGTTAIFSDVSLSHVAIYTVAISLSTVSAHYSSGSNAAPYPIGSSLAQPYNVNLTSITWQDAMTDTDGVQLASHTPTGGSGSWTKVFNNADAQGVAIIKENRAKVYRTDINGSVTSGYKFNLPSALTDGSVEADAYIAGSDGYLKLTIRDSGTTDYRVYLDNGDAGIGVGKVRLEKYNGTTRTQIGTDYTIPGYAQGNTYTVKLEVSGSTLNVYINGSLVITATDTTYSAATSQCVWESYSPVGQTDASGVHMDNFKVTKVS